MAIGASACVHLRNIKNVCLFARNEACSTPHRGLVQSRLPQFSRNIHTIRPTAIPLRSTRKLCLLGPIISGNQSALKGHRPITGAHYSTTPPLLSQPQQDTSTQIATVQLPIQRGILSTINEDARKVLEYANRDILWADSSRRREDQLQPRLPHHDPNDIARITANLPQFEHEANTSCNPDFQAFKKEELTLPVRRFTKQILSFIDSNIYSIIDGGSDSRNTTQVPQIILEDAFNKSSGVSCRVLCVQQKEPRGIKMPQRMAHETFEELGDTTSYGVLPDHIAPGEKITHCSRQGLLRILKNGHSSLEQFSHIILDEVHLRCLNINVGMMLLKRFVEQRKSIGASVPKVILMGSFTHVDDLCSYFGTKTTDGTLLPAPYVTLPTRFHVEKHYLEEVMGNIAHSLTPEILWPLLHDDKATRQFLDTHFKKFEKSETVTSNKSWEEVPCGLISATILSLLSTTNTGSIFVFIPGSSYTGRVINQIKAFGPKLGFDFADQDRFRIDQLHGNTAKNEKHKVHFDVPPGCRRIIISTNERNFIPPDVRYIVDSGKSTYLRGTHGQAASWITQTVALQRAKCGGRVQAGEYYFLGAKKCFDSLPVTRSLTGAAHLDLQQACLHVKRATSGTSSIAELFAQTYAPPQESSVRAAVDDLKELQVLDEREELTDLGHILVDLDMDPCFGKMVALGVIFQCLDPMLILASLGWDPRLFSQLLSSPDAGVDGPFSRSINESGYHVAITNTFGAIREMLHKEGKLPAFENAVSKYHISNLYRIATSEIERIIRRLIAAQIIPAGKLPSDGASFSSIGLNVNSKNEALIKTLLLQCLPSNLAVKGFGYSTIKFKSGEIVERDPNYSIYKSYIMAYNFGSVRTSTPNGMKQKTQVNPLAACLLGNKIKQEEDSIILDSWVKIKLQTVESNEVAKNLVQTHRVLNETLRTAFRILPRQTKASFDSQREWVSYRRARHHFFKTIQKTLQDILHANDPPLPPAGAGN
ncbi:hypothetical protein N7453_007335 [Penicillium expansum]|nr:hypothetical protein N7453_007335 [Penicillium expansum]